MCKDYDLIETLSIFKSQNCICVFKFLTLFQSNRFVPELVFNLTVACVFCVQTQQSAQKMKYR